MKWLCENLFYHWNKFPPEMIYIQTKFSFRLNQHIWTYCFTKMWFSHISLVTTYKHVLTPLPKNPFSKLTLVFISRCFGPCCFFFKVPHREIPPVPHLSFIICFHCDLIFSVTSHLSLHSSQLKIATMDISNQVSFDFHSLVWPFVL